MPVTREEFSLPGYCSHGTIIIHYDIPDGVQMVSACIPVCPYECTYQSIRINMYQSAPHSSTHPRASTYIHVRAHAHHYQYRDQHPLHTNTVGQEGHPHPGQPYKCAQRVHNAWACFQTTRKEGKS